MLYLQLDAKTTEFVLTVDEYEARFPGTVDGAVRLNQLLWEHNITAVQASSDLHHPAEYPQFEAHAIDIAAGCFEGAVAAGVVNINEVRDGACVSKQRRGGFLSMDGATTEFVLSDEDGKEHRFPGTVEGAAELTRFRIANLFTDCSMSSDFNHAKEFPRFDKRAIDAVAGDEGEPAAAGNRAAEAVTAKEGENV